MLRAAEPVEVLGLGSGGWSIMVEITFSTDCNEHELRQPRARQGKSQRACRFISGRPFLLSNQAGFYFTENGM
jgi:hypothetical protein